ncbi:MAG TPA: ATP-binding protein [Terriglobia bacterium]|nr:ATP-binding protein [Terriglobia bacterium]
MRLRSADQEHSTFRWMDLLWLVFLAGLAVLPPLAEIHKQLILAAIGLFQIFDGRILRALSPSRRNFYSILIKILLSSLLVAHTEGINSNYYAIYYLPIVSAAMLYGGWGTILWTLASCAAYGSFLVWALQVYRLTASGAVELAFRGLFFFLIAVVVNRFVSESRQQAVRYRKLAETLTETNRRLEQAEADARRSERLAALGQLSAGLAHEIRNPLGVIKGSAEMLSQKLETADHLTAELAGYISSEVERLNSLVSRFLDFARPLHVTLETQEIIPVIERALQSVQAPCPFPNIKIERRYEKRLPLLPLDGELCERVFANVFQNAYEAMPDGGTLRITAQPVDSGGRTGVLIEVEDTGAGVSQEQQKYIFNPFFTTKKTGVGLGLSIVSKIVDDHGGWIRQISKPGSGACFRMFFSS